MATPIFKFQHPDLPGEDLYFIHNTFFELPETIPMDLTTFIWYHLKTGRSLEGFFAAWDNLNQFQASLNGASFDNYFDENEKQQLNDVALFGLSIEEANKNQEATLKLIEFINAENYKSEDISDYANPSIKQDYSAGEIRLSFFYSHHCLMHYIWENFNDKLDDSESYKFDIKIIKSLIKINGLGLYLASESFKKDRALQLEAIKNDFRAFYFVDNSFKKDKSFVLEAVETNNKIFNFLEKKLKKDKDVLALISVNCNKEELPF